MVLKFFSQALLVLIFTQSVYASEPNVLLITVDGVRSQEVYYGVQKPNQANLSRGTELLPELKKAVKAGEAISFPTVWVANRTAISLPGYRSIFSGEYESTCRNNKCARTKRRTIYDDLIDQGFSRFQLASITTWPKIAYANESVAGQIFQNAGYKQYVDELPMSVDDEAFLKVVNQDIVKHTPKWKGKWDRQTFEVAMYHLKKYRPRLMNISFGDADEYAHRFNYYMYSRAIKRLDERLKLIREELDEMGEYGRNTSIIVTTDHGRGNGIFWSQHMNILKTSDRAWAFVFPSRAILEEKSLRPDSGRRYSHLDIRPTIETLLGVQPKQSPKNTGKSLVIFDQ
jgi:hypothetical protein